MWKDPRDPWAVAPFQRQVLSSGQRARLGLSARGVPVHPGDEPCFSDWAVIVKFVFEP